jgi:O-antigen/teichoic acid export membrane protein
MKSFVYSLINNKYIQGGTALMLSTVLINAVNYFFYILVAKTLGPQGYGEIVALFSYLALLGTPFAILSTLIIRRLGYAGEKRALVVQAFDKWFWERMKRLGIPILLVSLLVMPLIPKLTNLSDLSSWVLIAALLLGLLSMPYYGFVQGLHLFATYSLISVGSSVLKLSGAILVFIGIGDIRLVYGGFLMSLVFVFLSTVRMTRRQYHTTESKNPYEFQKNLRSILLQKNTLYAFISLVGITMIGNVDIFYVKKFMSAHDAGLYAAWGLFAKTILYFLGPINSMLLIFFSAKETKDTHRTVLNAVLLLLILVTSAAFFTYALFERQLIHLILSSKFDGLYGLLAQAALFGSAYSVVMIMNNYFLARKHRAQLLSFFSIPIYVVSLFLAGNSLQKVITVNIFYTCTLTLLYLGIYFQGSLSRFNNSPHE